MKMACFNGSVRMCPTLCDVNNVAIVVIVLTIHSTLIIFLHPYHYLFRLTRTHRCQPIDTVGVVRNGGGRFTRAIGVLIVIEAIIPEDRTITAHS